MPAASMEVSNSTADPTDSNSPPQLDTSSGNDVDAWKGEVTSPRRNDTRNDESDEANENKLEQSASSPEQSDLLGTSRFTQSPTRGSPSQPARPLLVASPSQLSAGSANSTSTSESKSQARNLNLITCEECGLICAGQSHYQVHIRSHTGERPFKCNICGVAFTQKGNLRRHYKIHSEEKPYQCPVCSYRCRRRDALNGHMRIHSDVRPYRCVYCARSYKSRQSLKEHEYQCPYKNDPVAQGQQGNAGSPAKTNISEKQTNKLSPIQSSFTQAQALQRILPSSVIPSVLQNQQLLGLNNATNSLMQTSGSATSSSGKRKASNPQKFTRFSKATSSSLVEAPKTSSFMNNSVANALQFMPSLLNTMMQQRQLQENLARQEPEERMSPQQDVAIDFSAKRPFIHAPASSETERISYATKRPRIDGEFVLATTSDSGDQENGRISPSEVAKSAFTAYTSAEDVGSYLSSMYANTEANGQQNFNNEKLSGSARRKRPRYMNERVLDARESPNPIDSKPLEIDTENGYYNSKSSPERSQHLTPKLSRYVRSPGATSLDLSNERALKREDAAVKDDEQNVRLLGNLQSGDASRSGIRLFLTTEAHGDIQELKAFVCSHCHCLFLDHVMFALHAGCHGFHDPLECNVCGYRATDRYQFQSHLTRGEHLVVGMSTGSTESDDPDAALSSKMSDGGDKVDTRSLSRADDAPVALTTMSKSESPLMHRFPTKAIVRY
uniref:Zinc finger protein Helios n=1 Tax=Phallusia mammillata TaxID=59560 RepID=A0A6F9DEJ3_9ASCI|nr:zinc finger protein Helios [Phallusia mammillata]